MKLWKIRLCPGGKPADVNNEILTIALSIKQPFRTVNLLIVSDCISFSLSFSSLP
jgi:hypothetical protein